MMSDSVLEVTKESPVVAVRCITYNHAPYIRECLEGFVMQQTDFPFIVVIHDDASTDGTATIIKEYENRYPHIIKPIYQIENQYSKGAFHRIVEAIDNAIPEQTQYIAMCEGDDYWTDPLKLQKQVDFLEQHPEYGMVYTNFNIYYQKQHLLRESLFTTQPDKFPAIYQSAADFIYAAGYVCPPSWLWRKSLPSKPVVKSADGTFVSFVHFLSVTKCHVLMDVTATYRYLEESASHTKDYNKLYRRNKSILETQCWLVDYYRLPQELKSRCEQKYYSSCLTQFVIQNKKEDIVEARKVLKNPSAKTRILFALNHPLGRLVLQWVYSLTEAYRNWKR